MRFAADEWLWGVFFSLLLAGILALQGVRLTRARRKFAHDERIAELLTATTGMRRTIQAVLSCLAVALAFVAAAQPQYGKGTRVLPATNLDVVIVLDYSKSMYARDVSPSRISRAKVEVGKLIRNLGGARFAAVAFAGENIAFPLTSDGSAIAQFFQGLDPNNMPVGGTAIARALESGRQLLDRDPLSKNHERVMILVTDGEDLEGDPVAVAQDAKAAGIRVDVVQIGGQSPEPIPEMDQQGVARGLRKDANGSLLTTQLTPEGEAQLASVAREGGGKLVRAAQGDTGIGEMTEELRKLMTEELSEKVETVFADVYYYPLALAVLLLLIETWVGTSKKRVFSPDPPKGHMQKRKPRRMRASAVLLALSCLGCAEFDALFLRESPVVNESIDLLKQKNPDKASKLLIEYLETGPCEAGVIGAGDRARALPDASFDLALSFSALTQKSPTSDGSVPPGPPGTPAPGGPAQVPGAQIPGAQTPGAQAPGPESGAPDQTIDCALRILGVISGNASATAELRARAHYVAGNLEMQRGNFEDAVVSYDAALLLAPGVTDEQLKKGPLAGTTADSLGILVAYNRALALRLQEEKEKQEKEKEEEEKQSNQDEPKDGDEEKKDDSSDEEEQEKGDEEKPEEEQEKQDEEKPEEQEKGDEEKPEEEQEKQDEPSQENQGDEKDSQDQPSPEEAASQDQAKSPSEARDQRMLDVLEQAPTLQQHRAQERKNQGVGVRSTMEDK